MGEQSLQDTILGSRYRLIHQVGKGGMAFVYKGYDQMLERPVAIKLLKQDFSADSGFRERFKQEARSAANLSHPNIVTVHDFGIDPAGVYIVMEYIAGTDLKTRIEENGRFSIEEGIKLMVQACAGLGYAHRAGIVHCDVKSQNILITPDQRLKITDFGIARALSSLDTESQIDVVWGSPQYLAPEQASGSVPTPSSDVYGLGVVMHEIFTGHLPFESKSAEDLMKMHREDTPDPLKHAPDLPEELVVILLKVLSKEPSARYRTADQLGHILANLLEKRLEPKAPAPPPVTHPTVHDQALQKPPATPPAITFEDDYSTPKQSVDWKLIWLELFTLLLVGGLIPFWLFIWFKLSMVIR